MAATKSRARKSSRKPRRDIRAEVTAKIVEALKQGVRPWSSPLREGCGARLVMPLRHGGESYRGINVLLLWVAAEQGGYRSPYWMTYRQAAELGGQVRKGEKGTMVVYYGTAKASEADAKGDSKRKESREGTDDGPRYSFLKSFNVFNADQVDGLPEKYAASTFPALQPPTWETVEEADTLFANCPAKVTQERGRCCYSIANDTVNIPPRGDFRNAAGYVSTVAHELIHWTGHKSRLDRYPAERTHADYAHEELIAEIGAAYLCGRLGLTAETLEDHASYLAHWIEALESDTSAIFKAASAAAKAADLIESYRTAKPDSVAPFALANEAPRKPPAKFTNTATTQRKLLDGLDCLPGQTDLF